MSEPEPLVVYSDYVCPFCYLGKRSLEAYLADAEDPPEVEWRAFDLRRHKRGPDGEIDPGIDDGKDEAYFQRARDNVERLAEEYDVDMTWDVDRDIDSWDAHKLSIHAQEEHGQDGFERLHEAIFTALWRDGRDIGDEDVLVELAAEAGIGQDEARQALGSEALDEEVSQRFQQAHRSGVTGVPTFIRGELRVPGAVPPEDIAQIVENA
ncbi:disulfide bond formation protein DsbA [Thermoplasmatales archaeon SW_10_69_26]|nr:MAG: disulfide bond formation protein DsbA [Thermoplasmatales archaeon SW_10_69_26]